MKIERADTHRCGLGEGAVWDADEQALYFLAVFLVFGADPGAKRDVEVMLFGKPRDFTKIALDGIGSDRVGLTFDDPQILVDILDARLITFFRILETL